jgi:hypothetical protein
MLIRCVALDSVSGYGASSSGLVVFVRHGDGSGVVFKKAKQENIVEKIKKRN